MKKLWAAFVAVILISFAVLGWAGVRIYQTQPPVPDRVETADGRVVIGDGGVAAGQDVWRAMGGMEVGSIWGHGSYVAPDWTADYLHREALFVLDRWGGESFGAPYDRLDAERQAQLRQRLQQVFRTNRYDAARRVLVVEPERAAAFEAAVAHYGDVFSNGRTEYAIPAGAVTGDERLRHLTAFFFWSSWAASTDRPGDTVTYTSNWPHEPLVGNRPTGEAIVWTGVSIIMLLGGIGVMAFWHATQQEEEPAAAPADDPLLGSRTTPSQRAPVK